MKEKFLEPGLEVIRFSIEDVVTTSGNGDPDALPPIVVG